MQANTDNNADAAQEEETKQEPSPASAPVTDFANISDDELERMVGQKIEQIKQRKM